MSQHYEKCRKYLKNKSGNRKHLKKHQHFLFLKPTIQDLKHMTEKTNPTPMIDFKQKSSDRKSWLPALLLIVLYLWQAADCTLTAHCKVYNMHCTCTCTCKCTCICKCTCYCTCYYKLNTLHCASYLVNFYHLPLQTSTICLNGTHDLYRKNINIQIP